MGKTGDYSTGYDARRQGSFDGISKTRKLKGVGGDAFSIEFLESGEELFNHHLRRNRFFLRFTKQVLDQKVLVGLIQPIPEILDANVTRCDFSVKTSLTLLFVIQRRK